MMQGNGAFGYDAHCNVDTPVDPTMAGLQLLRLWWLFDIRDLHDPKELGYYNPPGQTPLLEQGWLAKLATLWVC
ncbi:MAG: hypothetical protein R2693_07355 [Nocardioidaceae bacterium]